MSLQNKVAIITGASRGIGRAIAEALACEGAHVVLNGTNDMLLQEVCSLLNKKRNEPFMLQVMLVYQRQHFHSWSKRKHILDRLICSSTMLVSIYENQQSRHPLMSGND